MIKAVVANTRGRSRARAGQGREKSAPSSAARGQIAGNLSAGQLGKSLSGGWEDGRRDGLAEFDSVAPLYSLVVTCRTTHTGKACEMPTKSQDIRHSEVGI